jgi:hypothetical protein
MKHWKEVKDGENYNNNGISLIGEDNDNVLSIGEEDGQVKFSEECDGYYSILMLKEDAINALYEAIFWIEGSPGLRGK